MPTIALDAGGGDFAPRETVAGAVAAAAQGIDVLLVGDRPALQKELEGHEAELPIVHAPAVVGMGDFPIKAIREVPDSSVVVCGNLVSSGEADGFVSAGSTGASLAVAAVGIGRLPGVSRPAIASLLTIPWNPTVLCDAGANLVVRPSQLVEFAVMGSVVAETTAGVENPRVGLLNNGSEDSKGREMEREGLALLRESPVNFVGNVEGSDFATGKVDVIVTDGFTGNVFLKTVEASVVMSAKAFFSMLAESEPEAEEKVRPRFSAQGRKLMDDRHAGAHLVGAKGIAVIAHGHARSAAITKALQMANEGSRYRLPERIGERFLCR
nr:phosphate acyltransferase PlsX [bacterium]